ncbi:sugar ABC transporter permease [Streptomyces sp. 110]|uniref:Sugar ABC transporter permease n=1 Tax=Streptomyces endocoffeicus TaxID=2898945 RepID=A0ABS1Q8C5_9ACTN|nr:sugar ABC transporter permease [Streptomyces endocoffeicus]MBL1120928.1 sugar ABC transporter permease [Streptomyces endocoffeicus]
MKRPKRARREHALGWVLTGPAMFLLGVFVVAPVLLVLVLTVFDYDPFTHAFQFVGLRNFQRVLPSHELWQATMNTIEYTAITVPVTLGGGLVIALLIHGLSRGAGFWRSVYFLPVAATLTAMSVVWRFLFYPGSGLVDSTLGGWFGLRDWLDSTSLALPAVAVVGSWAGLGSAVVLFLAGLSAVPAHLHEVAALDGASAWHRFWTVTWPALGPATVFTLVLTVRDALRVFDQVRVVTGGGPLNSSQTLSVLLWQRGIKFLDIGGSSVVNLVLLTILLGTTLLQLRTFGRRWEAAGTR